MLFLSIFLGLFVLRFKLLRNFKMDLFGVSVRRSLRYSLRSSFRCLLRISLWKLFLYFFRYYCLFSTLNWSLWYCIFLVSRLAYIIYCFICSQFRNIQSLKLCRTAFSFQKTSVFSGGSFQTILSILFFFLHYMPII